MKIKTPLDDISKTLARPATYKVNEEGRFIQSVEVGDIDCDGKSDYATKELRGTNHLHSPWRMKLSSRTLYARPSMINDGMETYTIGDRVNFEVNGVTMEGNIVDFDISHRSLVVYGVEFPNDSGKTVIEAIIKADDGEEYLIDTRAEDFRRIFTPEELPVAEQELKTS